MTAITTAAKEPYTLPTPERVSRTMYIIPSFNMRERAKGTQWVVTQEREGWYCHCKYYVNPYACKHINRLVDYLFEQDLVAALPEPIKAAGKADGLRLEDLFDYSSR